MSQYHKSNIRRTFKVRTIDPDDNGELYYGQELTVVGETRDGRYQVRDDAGRFGRFPKHLFETIDQPKPKRISSNRRVKTPPAPPVRCAVSLGSLCLAYDARKQLWYSNEGFAWFRSRKEAHRAIWHTVQSNVWVEGYDPKVEAEKYEIVPVLKPDPNQYPDEELPYVMVEW